VLIPSLHVTDSRTLICFCRLIFGFSIVFHNKLWWRLPCFKIKFFFCSPFPVVIPVATHINQVCLKYLNSDKYVWFVVLCCDSIEFCLLIHSTTLFNKVNKDPVYQTDLHFLKRLNSFEKDFGIQFTPLLYFSQNSFLQAS